MENEIPDLLLLLGDNTYPLLHIGSKNEVIQHQAAEVGTEDTENHRLHIIDEHRRQRYAHAGQRHRLPQLHVEILIQKFGHNIQAAGRGVAVEEHGQSHAHQEDIADHIQKRISHQGGKVREQPLQHSQQGRQQKRRIHRLSAELPANEQESQQQQRHVQNHGYGRDGQRNHCSQHHGQTGHTAHRHLAGDHEKIHRRRHDSGSYRDKQEFPHHISQLFCIHFVILPTFSTITRRIWSLFCPICPRTPETAGA